MEALKNITVERETDLVFTDSDDVLTFVLADGSEYTYTFENGRLVLDGHYYEVDGFTEVSRVLGAFEE